MCFVIIIARLFYFWILHLVVNWKVFTIYLSMSLILRVLFLYLCTYVSHSFQISLLVWAIVSALLYLVQFYLCNAFLIIHCFT